ncbi:hypothetical protein SAICODRAFT_10019 [Saitoella complicata NRRL Y-17804]|uniref:uncharacterized protein n=1 Tax=Saitoella complicata (strain BCRC 22490 / CBS 7301 / JCM 7358 / NBRC 10748 / NRRL Y-17804) TaxID=698492 RepID=UPI00086731BF|nr:uncharacterized protein SAICODRAFT_10019 [Saitoella complicata NRRL Y-17804]ODQ50217.1 hypothetical protein SAICODRAFT_10019 [Saitoella complicata NRRL Y-17804]
MAQGGFKLKAAASKGKTQKLTKGAVHIAPKKTILVKQQALAKKLTASIQRKNEAVLAARAAATGKLSLGSMRDMAKEKKADKKGKKGHAPAKK